MVLITVKNVDITVAGELPKSVRDEIRVKVSYVIPNAKYTNAGASGWDGSKTCARISGGALILPAGLLSYVREVLDKNKVPYNFRDQRFPVTKTMGWSLEGLELRDYQVPVVNSILEKQRGVMKASTGSGKTEMIVSSMVQASYFPSVFYVTSCDLLEQAYDRFLKYARFNGEVAPIGRVGAGYCDIQPITIATVQSCERALSGKYTSFDDCSSDDKTEFTDSQKGHIVEMVNEAQFSYIDECFDYYTMVRLADGTKERIGKLVNSKFDGDVMSFNKKTKLFEPKKVVGWFKKVPTNQMVRIRIGNVAGINCTDNHIFYSTEGPIEAGNLKPGDAIISTLKDKRSVQKLSEEGRQVILGSSLGDGSLQFGCKRSISARFVTTHCYEQEEYLKYKYSFFDKLVATDDIGKSGFTGRSEPRKITFSSPELTKILKMTKKQRVESLDWLGLAMLYFDDGSLSKKNNTGTIAIYTMPDDAASALQDKFHSLGIKTSIIPTSKGNVLNISTIPMRKFAANISKYCPPCLKYKLPIDFIKSELYIPKNFPNYGVIPVVSVEKISIENRPYANERNVYCLTVEDNHNFVANGCVVKNCQHCSCDTIQSISRASHRSRLRIGGSASPWRDDGLDILIEAQFGKRLCDISASYLIKKNFLVKPEITFNHFSQISKSASFQSHYRSSVVDNLIRNRFIAERALFHIQRNRPTIILVKWAEHAEIIAGMIPGAEILTSSGPSAKLPKKRKEILNLMRERKVMCIIGTTLLDEGVDVPAAGAGIFAGGGKSSTRELQRVGRFIRKDPIDPDKSVAYIEEFFDHSKWLTRHTNLRRKILKTEPLFDIFDNRKTLEL